MSTLEHTVNRGGKYLTFSLASEEYGIGILKVKEIIGMMPVTPIPQTPSFVKGVINLRGKVIPVISLRRKFGMDDIEYSERGCIIVVEIQTDSSHVLVGIMVDSVSEVTAIRQADIEDPPSFGISVDTSFLSGMAKIGNGVKSLLDIDRVMSSGEIMNLPQSIEL